MHQTSVVENTPNTSLVRYSTKNHGPNLARTHSVRRLASLLFVERVPNLFIALICSMLTVVVEKRITMPEIYAHPWFTR